jgi:hypothetical protein
MVICSSANEQGVTTNDHPRPNSEGYETRLHRPTPDMIMKHFLERIAPFLTAVSIACGSTPPSEEPQSIQDQIPTAPPVWLPLNVPQSSITLPAFMVGEQRQLSSGCWAPATPIEGAPASNIVWEQSKQSALDAQLKVAFSKYLVDAKLDASIMNALDQTWKLDLEEVSYVNVDPATIRPNFNNEACTTAELKWFENGRFVVTQGIRAKRAKITATASASAEQQAQLDTAIQKFNLEFRTGFKRSSGSDANLQIDATDAYIGAVGTSLVASSCSTPKPFKIVAGREVTLCSGAYTIAIQPAPVGTRVRLSVTPRSGTTAQFDLDSGVQGVFQLGELRILFARVTRVGSELRVDNFTAQLVGAGG